MSRRVSALLAALVLAVGGTIALVAYVATVEDRALAGERLVEVLVVAEPVTAGTPVEALGDLLTVERVPVKVRADGALADLDGLDGRVAAVDLVPGEQLMASRLVARTALSDREIGIDVPEDLVELTIELPGQRAVGGLLTPGQTVAVIASFDPFQLSETVIDVDGLPIPLPSAVGDGGAASTPNSTDLLLRKVLVTAVQEREGSRSAEGDRLTDAPDESVFVTMAVDPYDAERLVFAAEFGSLWLAVERETVPELPTPGQTRGSVLIEPRRAG